MLLQHSKTCHFVIKTHSCPRMWLLTCIENATILVLDHCCTTKAYLLYFYLSYTVHLFLLCPLLPLHLLSVSVFPLIVAYKFLISFTYFLILLLYLLSILLFGSCNWRSLLFSLRFQEFSTIHIFLDRIWCPKIAVPVSVQVLLTSSLAHQCPPM